MERSKKFSAQTILDPKIMGYGIGGLDESMIIKKSKDDLILQIVRKMEEEGMIDINVTEGGFGGNLEIRCSVEICYPIRYKDPMWCKI